MKDADFINILNLNAASPIGSAPGPGGSMCFASTARRRFGEACVEALVPLLKRYEERETLAEVGAWIVICDSAEALRDRARMPIA